MSWRLKSRSKMRIMVQQALTHGIHADDEYRLTSCSQAMPLCIAVPSVEMLQLTPRISTRARLTSSFSQLGLAGNQTLALAMASCTLSGLPISSSIFSTASLAPPWAGPHRAAIPDAMQAKGLAWLEPACSSSSLRYPG